MGTNLSEENISSAAAVRAGRVGRWLDEEPGRAGLGVYITYAVISGHRIVTHLKLENQGRDGTHLSLSLSLFTRFRKGLLFPMSASTSRWNHVNDGVERTGRADAIPRG
jgi:hypothetical protein